MTVLWGVTDGSAGTMAQVKALAAALGEPVIQKRVIVGKPWVWFPASWYTPFLQRILPHVIYVYEGVGVPWPEVVISCGRRGALAALAIKQLMRRQGRKARFLHIQDPRMNADNFDMIVAMEHDPITGGNVMKVPFALHAISPEALEEAKQKYAKRFSLYSKPYITVLLGGSTNKYTLTEEHMKSVIESLKHIYSSMSGSMLITASRRTGHENLQRLIEAFPRTRDSRVYIYDGVGDNPYLGMLALAEQIIVTNDSVNMMSEARATGKPLYILDLPGHVDTKPARFAERLISDGVARPLSAKLETWSYPAADDMKELAGEVKRRLAL